MALGSLSLEIDDAIQDAIDSANSTAKYFAADRAGMKLQVNRYFKRMKRSSEMST